MGDRRISRVSARQPLHPVVQVGRGERRRSSMPRSSTSATASRNWASCSSRSWSRTRAASSTRGRTGSSSGGRSNMPARGPTRRWRGTRYDAMFKGFGAEIHYVYEPLGAAFSYASRLTEPATILVADFGGGTSDFSVVRVAEPGAARRCTPLGHAGVGIAGDRFDYRIVDRLVLPMLGKGGAYQSFDKVLEIPRGYFADFADWSRLALMRNRKTMTELERLQQHRGRSGRDRADDRGDRERARLSAVRRGRAAEARAVERRGRAFPLRGRGAGDRGGRDARRSSRAGSPTTSCGSRRRSTGRLEVANVGGGEIDRVFLTGGSSLIPRIRADLRRALRRGARSRAAAS